MNTRSITNLMKSIATGFILAMFLAACQQPDSKVQDAKDEVAIAGQDLKDARREVRAEFQENWLRYKTDNDEVFADNERSIIELRSEVSDIDLQYRGKYTTQIDDIERRNNALRDRVNNYTDEGDEKWEEFKRDIDRAMDDLTSARKNITVKNG